MSAYGVPGDRHTTVDPSPIDHTTRSTRPVAVTENPPADTDRVTGPQEDADGSSTHIHVGNPTKPTRLGAGSGTIPTSTARSRIAATACCANTRGSGGAAGPAGGVNDQRCDKPVPTSPGLRQL